MLHNLMLYERQAAFSNTGGRFSGSVETRPGRRAGRREQPIYG